MLRNNSVDESTNSLIWTEFSRLIVTRKLSIKDNDGIFASGQTSLKVVTNVSRNLLIDFVDSIWERSLFYFSTQWYTVLSPKDYHPERLTVSPKD